MNAIRATQALNKRELENAVPPSASWHADYRDTAYVYIGGLPLDLSEGDVVTIFSQYGNPTHLNLIRDQETGKSKGFAFLKYEDQRSCDLAVDNLGGADVLGRLLRVDHTRYKKKDGEDEDTYRIERLEAEGEAHGSKQRGSESDESMGDQKRSRKRRSMRDRDDKEQLRITDLGARDDEEDPMKDYLKKENNGDKRKHRHHHRHRDHSRDHGEDDRRRRHRYKNHSDDEDRGSHSHRRRDRDDQAKGVRKESRRHRDE